MTTAELPSLEYLRQCVSYDAETGGITWLARPREHFSTDSSWRSWNTLHGGKPAGSYRGDGYRRFKLGYVEFVAHRVGYALFHGLEIADLPPELDHINGRRSDNRIANIRAATHVENARNQKLRSDSQSGHKGVTRNKRDGRYQARICLYGKLKHLGCFDTPDQAAAAYRAAAKKHFGEYARAA